LFADGVIPCGHIPHLYNPILSAQEGASNEEDNLVLRRDWGRQGLIF
jgi:hypothetical protein